MKTSTTRQTANYYIDTENIGSKWINIIIESKNTSIKQIFHIFYTSKNNILKLSYCTLNSLVRMQPRLNFHPCQPGNNALDFQLIAELGINIQKNQTYYIVSNDRDYEIPIDYLNKKGYKIKQLKPEDLKNYII